MTNQKPDASQWRWRYSKWTGIMYGPVPVGTIIILIGMAFYYGLMKPADRQVYRPETDVKPQGLVSQTASVWTDYYFPSQSKQRKRLKINLPIQLEERQVEIPADMKSQSSSIDHYTYYQGTGPGGLTVAVLYLAAKRGTSVNAGIGVEGGVARIYRRYPQIKDLNITITERGNMRGAFRGTGTMANGFSFLDGLYLASLETSEMWSLTLIGVVNPEAQDAAKRIITSSEIVQ